MKVRLPASLSQPGKSGMIDVELEADGTLRSLVEAIESRYPGSTDKLVDRNGGLHSYVNFYVNGNDVRDAGGLSTPVTDRDEVVILPAISGG